MVDVLSILVLDAVVLLVANGLIVLVEYFTRGENVFFKAAKDLSHGSFLLLYVAWVAWDIWEFVKQPRVSG
jgi:hypothetical protein